MAKMLTIGVLDNYDHIAVDAWGDFDPKAGVKLLKPMLGKAGKPEFVASLTKFLKKYDTDASRKDRLDNEEQLALEIDTANSFGSLHALMSAGSFPSWRVASSLLDRVKLSDDYLVRYHASNSLLKMAGKKKAIGSRRRLFRLIISQVKDGEELPDTEQDKKRYKKAARIFKRMLVIRWPYIQIRALITLLMSRDGD
ncbi:hypothetical protein HQ524_03645 [Candidatus Uhrbacteria bacterium]|nr:hypothetical protein [Candidatus Uhrbacteria bacterium]